MTLQQRVGKVITQLRKERGMSQNSLCWDIGISPKYMSGLELGKRNLSIGELSHITDYYGIKISEFFRMVEAVEDYG